jgi:D-glycero-D-manno-heptose 1,7-bisphosphate phosphatase
MSQPAIFLDRDGTIMEDREYLRDPAGVSLLPGVGAALRRLKDAGYLLVVITNQSGIGRGWMTVADYDRVSAELARQLAAVGVVLDGVYYCPAGPAETGCEEHPDRKPLPGLFLRAIQELNIDVSRSFAIGDSLRDLIAARTAGCPTGFLVRTGKPVPDGADREWRVVADLPSAVDAILLWRQAY